MDLKVVEKRLKKINPKASISYSERKGKRFKLKLPGGEVIHFGSKSGETFIDHMDETKRKNWIARHKKQGLKDNTWDNPSSARYWSRVLLW